MKDFCYSNLAWAKLTLIASKLVLLDSGLNMMLLKSIFIPTPKIKQLFCVICLLFTIFLVLVLVSIALAKPKKLYMKGQLKMVGLIRTVLFTTISTTAQVSNICLILRHCIRHCFVIITYSKCDKFDLRTARINLVQDKLI